MGKRWKWFTAFIIILLWNGCGKERAESDPNLLSTSTVLVTIQPMVEGNRTSTEPMEPTTGAAVPTAPVNSTMPILADEEPSFDGVLPDYNPAEILRQTGGTVIPWGDSISLDMDGDGKEETVSMRLTLDSEYSSNDWRTALPILTVDGAVFGEEDFLQLCYPQSDIGGGFERLGWYILDIDTSDSYLEIAVEYWYRNARTSFLRYGEGEFVYVGTIETNISLFESFFLPVREESEWEIPWEPDWEAARLEIQNTEKRLRMDGIRGDGMIQLSAYHNVLETCEEMRKMTWRLENPEDLHAELVLDLPYLDFGEMPGRNRIPGLKVLKQDTVFYQNKGGEDGATVTLLAGTEVWFRRYYLEGRWIEMVYDEGGVYEEGAQSVWFQVVVEIEENIGEYPYGLIRLPDGEIAPRDCFGGNYIWGG